MSLLEDIGDMSLIGERSPLENMVLLGEMSFESMLSTSSDLESPVIIGLINVDTLLMFVLFLYLFKLHNLT